MGEMADALGKLFDLQNSNAEKLKTLVESLMADVERLQERVTVLEARINPDPDAPRGKHPDDCEYWPNGLERK